MQTESVQLLQAVRSQTEKLCEPLEVEDYVIQSCEDVSPTKWHLAHTSWFFETFLLQPFFTGYEVFHPQYTELFNSYYNAVGPQFSRSHRGTLSRPTVSEVMAYRHHVTDHLIELLSQGDCPNQAEISRRIELGVHHEQQHQVDDDGHQALLSSSLPRLTGLSRFAGSIQPERELGQL